MHPVLTLTEKAQDTNPIKILENGGDVILTCSNCDKHLVIVTISRPKEKFEWQVRAKCCFCGDKSFVKDIKGGFHYRGYDIQEGENFIPKVNIKDVKTNGNIVEIETEKAK